MTALQAVIHGQVRCVAVDGVRTLPLLTKPGHDMCENENAAPLTERGVLPGDLTERCRSLRDDVRRIAKIPTCIGWGPTKTIAKLANGIAKDNPDLGGVPLREGGSDVERSRASR